MTRINTNVSSVVGRNNLARSNASLSQALTRLSTGLRINTGKDDPAGLIASENLRSDITSVRKAITNTDRANQVIATSDSALGQVSSLLNDIRGLVTESANSGALSDAQIAANQSQVDSSLEALNRIAQTTTFQGRKLLDGSLDFTTTAGSNFAKLTDLQIDQANLGDAGSLSVSINVTTAAEKANISDINISPTSTAAVKAFQSTTLSHVVAQATGGTVTIGAETFGLAADAGGQAAGAEGNQAVNVAITYGAGSASTSYTAGTNTLNVSVTQASGVATVNDIKAAIDAGSDFTTSGASNTNTLAATTGSISGLTGGRDAGSATIKVVADASGTSFNGKTVTISEDSGIDNNTALAELDGSNNITVKVRGTVGYAAIKNAIDGLTGYSASITSSSGDQNYIDSADAPPSAVTLGGGVDASGGLAKDVVFSLSGKNGSEVFNFQAQTTISQVRDAINLVKDATGVEASIDSSDTSKLVLTSADYGANAFVDIQVISEATGGTITSAIGQGKRDIGADLVATVNGTTINGDGNSLSINTATLDFKATLEAAFTGSVAFSVTGGGALFQLGPDVVSNQQARFGIRSVNTGQLGGESGKLYELLSGGLADLKTDPTKAADIIAEAIDQVTSLRGRLGAFQRTTLETNKNALGDTLVNLQDAESAIRDADFAEETANLTRAQILVQSGTRVLAIANQNPQNVLGLLQ